MRIDYPKTRWDFLTKLIEILIDFYENTKTEIRVFFLRIRKIFQWIPIIWKYYYSWDFYSAIGVFKFQLQNIEKSLNSNLSYSKDAKIYASKIRTAIRLMDKVYNDEYEYWYLDEIERLYGKNSTEFIEIEIENDKNQKLYKMETVFEKEYTVEELQKIEKHTYELAKISLDKQSKAHRILWKFIEHNIRHWWD